ncbi:MAG: nucleotide sugar dehydrogenase [Proteobacteria bacterium]|nr:nucleotide sugar dehydrogenase [Pseudomonadota bacterium]MBI3500021.1 nucleotide sugar dehydrogenase [Pseudomonadota bacterium]
MAVPPSIVVVGLGYVGLPLAVALSRHFPVAGYDVDRERIAELKRGHDRNGEIGPDSLAVLGSALADDPAILAGRDIYIVTAPTPVDADNRPDLSAVIQASDTIGSRLGPGAIVVYESTVYPGVTEGVAGPRLEAASGLKCGRDFFLGYSPERINVGDPEHGLAGLPKVVAGQTEDVAKRLEAIYGRIAASVHRAKDIRTAEAAKVIENAQRDINIAFVNEVAMIFDRMGLSMHDVLEAASTKWNFHAYTPGLVGGHCIGVDPFYLAHAALEVGIEPAIVLAGRRINDAMGEFFAERIWQELGRPSTARVLVLGLAFKENVRDLRNSKVADLVRGLERRGAEVRVHDALADAAEALSLYGIELEGDLDGLGPFDALVGAVAHLAYRRLGAADLQRLVRPGGVIADIKGIWRGVTLPEGRKLWTL